MASSSTRSKKHKANTACNTCRQRKTRCDGEKPSCSYCRTTGVPCIYRVQYNESSLMSEQPVLERLARIEARLDLLDHLPFEGNHVPQQAHSFDNSLLRRSFGLVTNLPHIPGIEASHTHRADAMPAFHTAATHKMLHYWPRVSMALTIRDIDPLKYVEESHRLSLPPLVEDNEIEVDFDFIQVLLEQADQNCTGINYLLCDLVQRHSNIFNVLRQPCSPSSATVVSKQFTCEQLLTINLAARQFQDPSNDQAKAAARKIQDWSFKGAYAKISRLLFQSDDESAAFLLLGAHILMSDTYPNGALTLIQTAGDRLGRCNRRPINEDPQKERLYCCLRLHHIIESEILLTMDGLPSEAVSAALHQTSYMKTLKEFENGYINLPLAEIAKLKIAEQLSEATFVICGIQNKVLTQIYSFEQAYSRPSFLASSIVDLKTQLCAWFDALPLEWHFPRDLRGVMSIPSPAPDFLRPLRMKYYLVEFLMCRPVLYYIAHENVENPFDHELNNSPEESTTSQEEHPFWVYDACYRCLQCAALIIIGDETPASTESVKCQRDWFELHITWGAALTLAVAAATRSLAKFLPHYGKSTNALSLLSRAEDILQAASLQNEIVGRCVHYLRDVKEHMITDTSHLMIEATMDESIDDAEAIDDS